MTYRQTGPVEVLPNTLRDQAVPNTFRSQAGPGTVEKPPINSGGGNAGPARRVARPRLNRGGGNAGPARRVARPQLRLWVYVALAMLAVFVALYLLSGTQ